MGIALFMGGSTMPNRAVEQTGFAYRLQGSLMQQEINRNGSLLRWLLLSLDCLPSNEFTMTQELIANMLGVRREVVTEAAGKLQEAGLIEYGRGRIKVMDRPGSEARVCKCYQVIKTETDRLLPGLHIMAVSD